MTTKEKILTLLQKEDTVLSGEKLAQALSISRTAVWKAIKELEKEGYHFEHLANGYRFVSADRYDQAALAAALPMIPMIQIKDAVESTMKEAKIAALDSGLATPPFFDRNANRRPWPLRTTVFLTEKTRDLHELALKTQPSVSRIAAIYRFGCGGSRRSHRCPSNEGNGH